MIIGKEKSTIKEERKKNKEGKIVHCEFVWFYEHIIHHFKYPPQRRKIKEMKMCSIAKPYKHHIVHFI